DPQGTRSRAHAHGPARARSLPASLRSPGARARPTANLTPGRHRIAACNGATMPFVGESSSSPPRPLQCATLPRAGFPGANSPCLLLTGGTPMRPSVRPLFLSCAVALLALPACRNAEQVTAESPQPAVSPPEFAMVGAHLLEGLGNHDFPVTTTHPEVQRWFNQGLMLTFGFNHDAAERTFLKATELDPDCAMCWC